MGQNAPGALPGSEGAEWHTEFLLEEVKETRERQVNGLGAAINFLLNDALAGGGPASARFDPLGKGNAQILLDIPVRVPASLVGMIWDGGVAE